MPSTVNGYDSEEWIECKTTQNRHYHCAQMAAEMVDNTSPSRYEKRIDWIDARVRRVKDDFSNALVKDVETYRKTLDLFADVRGRYVWLLDKHGVE